jgi:septal ring factor EnvC (AmiA/AmiB activator)
MRLFAFYFFLLSVTSFAAPNVTKLANDFEKTKKSLVQDEVKQRKIMSSLFSINRKMKKIVADRAALVQERMLLDSVTRDLALAIRSLDEKVKTQKSHLMQRLAVIYRFGGQGVTRFLFSSLSSAELERNLKILGVVAKHDLGLIKDYSVSVNDLAKKKKKFQLRLAHLKKIEDNIQEKETKLTQENEYKNKILDSIRRSKKFALNKISGLRERSAQLAMNDDSGVLDLLFRPSFFEKKGQLTAPVQGPIVENFGLMRDEENNVTLSHKGVFFAASKGAPVKSVFSGKVAFVGRVSGFGQTLIMDHGDHYYTVYSHNQTISVNVGEEIKQNQIVATAGIDPESLKTGVYFEVRHFSEPYDPRSWMKGFL